MRIPFLTFIGLLIGLQTGNSQIKISLSALQEDLNIVQEITLGLSPKLTESDRLQIQMVLDQKKKELDSDSLTTLAFFNFLIDIDINSKFDEHAQWNLTEKFLMPILEKGNLFPLPIKIIGSKMVVNDTTVDLPYGAIIHSINGEPIDTLMKSVDRDYQETFAQRQMEFQFSIMYLIRKGSAESYVMKYSLPTEPSHILEKSIKGIDFDTYQKTFSDTVFPLNKEGLSNFVYSRHFEEERIFYLKLNSFNWYENSPKKVSIFPKSVYKKFNQHFASLFKEMAELAVEHLIIDLRFNQGGNVKIPGLLYSYLAQEAFNESLLLKIQNFDIPHVEHLNKIEGQENITSKDVAQFIKKMRKEFKKKNDSTELWTLSENEVRQPKKSSFDGNVYLLVGGRSLSASSYFTALFKSHERGMIIGEQMGGSYRSLTAGKMLTYQLPNTKIELAAPIMVVDFADELYQKIDEEKITPDLIFSDDETYQYFLEKKDLEMERVFQLIKEPN
ncbi:MAG: S41 family peptidase [Cytophagales bacterium]